MSSFEKELIPKLLLSFLTFFHKLLSIFMSLNFVFIRMLSLDFFDHKLLFKNYKPIIKRNRRKGINFINMCY